MRRPGIDAALAQGLSAAAIARDQTETGFSISAGAVVNHRDHYSPPVSVTNPGARKRDAAIIIRDRILDALEDVPQQMEITDKNGTVTVVPGILDKNLQPALGSALKAQSELNKVAMKKDDRSIKIEMAILLGGGPPPLRLVGPGVIDGEFDEVPDVAD